MYIYNVLHIALTAINQACKLEKASLKLSRQENCCFCCWAHFNATLKIFKILTPSSNMKTHLNREFQCSQKTKYLMECIQVYIHISHHTFSVQLLWLSETTNHTYMWMFRICLSQWCSHSVLSCAMHGTSSGRE